MKKSRLLKTCMMLFPAVLLLTVSCALDLSGLFYSQTDADGRFQEQQSCPSVMPFSSTNLPFSFVVIADSHVYGSQNANFAKLKTKLTITDQAVFLAGDMTQNGNSNDFVLCRQGLSSLGITTYTTPGNHDLFYGGWNNYKSVFGRSSYTFSAGPVRFIVLDTASGGIGAYQKKWLEDVLAARTEPYCFVITHINLVNFNVGGISQITDNEEIAYLMHLFETKSLGYYLCGHVHQQDDTAVNGVRYISISDFRDGPSYFRVTISSGGVSYQFY